MGSKQSQPQPPEEQRDANVASVAVVGLTCSGKSTVWLQLGLYFAKAQIMSDSALEQMQKLCHNRFPHALRFLLHNEPPQHQKEVLSRALQICLDQQLPIVDLKQLEEVGNLLQDASLRPLLPLHWNTSDLFNSAVRVLSPNCLPDENDLIRFGMKMERVYSDFRFEDDVSHDSYRVTCLYSTSGQNRRHWNAILLRCSHVIYCVSLIQFLEPAQRRPSILHQLMGAFRDFVTDKTSEYSAHLHPLGCPP